MQQCQVCKSWYAIDTVHACSPWFGGTTPTQTSSGPWFDNVALQRIATALERIATALETPKKAVKRRAQ